MFNFHLNDKRNKKKRKVYAAIFLLLFFVLFRLNIRSQSVKGKKNNKIGDCSPLKNTWNVTVNATDEAHTKSHTKPTKKNLNDVKCIVHERVCFCVCVHYALNDIHTHIYSIWNDICLNIFKVLSNMKYTHAKVAAVTKPCVLPTLWRI